MAKVRYNRKTIEKEIKLDEKNLKKMSLFGTTVENLTSEELELEIPANRPDLLSTGGFMRAFKMFTGEEKEVKKYTPKKNKEYSVTVDKSVKDIWPYTVCAVVKNLKLDHEDVQEIITLQEKLSSTLGRNRKKAGLGIYPLHKLSFPIRYEAWKPENIAFRPLGFPKEMNAEQILQKHPTGKEYASILRDKPRYPLFIDAKKKILSMPPIINSEETGHVDENTNDVFIECSGIDLRTLQKMLIIFTAELVDRGGTLYEVHMKDTPEIYTPSFESERKKIKKENIESLLGIKLSEKEIETLLLRMGHEYKAGTVKSPAWRNDLLHEVDIAEDVLIAYGYEKLVPTIPSIGTLGQQSQTTTVRAHIREILNGLGLLELSSLHFITKEEADLCNPKCVEVENPRTEYALLRPNLTIPLLRTLAANRDTEYPQNAYEIGPIFRLDGESETGVSENEHLVIGLTPSNFTKAKQVLDYLMRMLNHTYALKETEVEGLIEGRTGHIMLNNRSIGHIGEVHPTTLRAWKLKMPLTLIEIDLTSLLKK